MFGGSDPFFWDWGLDSVWGLRTRSFGLGVRICLGLRTRLLWAMAFPALYRAYVFGCDAAADRPAPNPLDSRPRRSENTGPRLGKAVAHNDAAQTNKSHFVEY